MGVVVLGRRGWGRVELGRRGRCSARQPRPHSGVGGGVVVDDVAGEAPERGDGADGFVVGGGDGEADRGVSRVASDVSIPTGF